LSGLMWLTFTPDKDKGKCCSKVHPPSEKNKLRTKPNTFYEPKVQCSLTVYVTVWFR